MEASEAVDSPQVHPEAKAEEHQVTDLAKSLGRALSQAIKATFGTGMFCFLICRQMQAMMLGKLLTVHLAAS